MKLLILGGSTTHLGGVEAFCERARLAIERDDAYQIDRLPTESAYVNLKRLPQVLRGLANLIAYRGARPDVVWLQYVNLIDLSYLLVAKAVGYRIMVTPHLGLNWRSQSNPWLRNLSCGILGLASRLALISKTQEDEIKLPTHVPRSAVRNFLPTTVGLNEVHPRAERSGVELQLLHAGRLSEAKGTFRFIETCRQLQALGVPFTARLAGGADEATREEIRSQVERAGLGDNFVVLGRVSDEALLELLRTSDALVHLSVVDSYPLIVLECLAFGCFPICLDLAGARDMVETYDGKIVSPQHSVEETVAFLKDQDLETMRARALKGGARMRADYAWPECVTLARAALEATTDRSN